MSPSASHAALPETAPFPSEQIRQFNTLLAGTSALQRSWLSGFLAGFDAAAAPATAAPPAAKPRLTILFATESGNAEALAGQARRAAAHQGFAASVLDMADTTPEALIGLRNLIVIASTWGEGEPPQRAAAFHSALMADSAPRLDGLRFAVLALGDRAYAQFCAIGTAIDARLAALGAERATPLLACDLDYEAPASAWITTTLKALAPERPEAEIIQLEPRRHSAAGPDRAHPFAAEVTEHINLHSSRSSAETVHLELSLAGSGIEYEPGDALAVLAPNDPAEIARLLDAAGLSGDPALNETLARGRDITTLTQPMLAAYAELTGDIALHALARDPEAASAYARANRPRDLLGAAPARLTPEQVLGLLRPLAPRSYSIASSRKAVGEQADLLVALLSFTHDAETRFGVASHHLARATRRGAALSVWLKPNPHFRLPADPDRPILMIGPGTGVAPFRAFIQERRETGARGRTWLFFGHRRFTHDFLYQLEWQQALKDGSLSALDLAFSRDQPEKRYVQHRLWDRRDRVRGFINDGATIYLCGDRAMADGVEATLGRIFDEAGGQGVAALAQLRQEGRLLKDVY